LKGLSITVARIIKMANQSCWQLAVVVEFLPFTFGDLSSQMIWSEIRQVDFENIFPSTHTLH
jgi:hypothetical protein